MTILVDSIYGNTNTNDAFGTGDTRDSLILDLVTLDIQTDDILVCFETMNAGASATTGTTLISPRKVDGTATDATAVGGGTSGFNSLMLVAASGWVINSDIPRYVQGFYRDPAVLTNTQLAGGVMVFRNFVWNAAGCAPAVAGTMVGPTTGDVTPLKDVIAGPQAADLIEVLLFIAKWSGTDTDLPVGTPVAVYTDDGLAQAGASATGRRAIYASYALIPAADDSPADEVILDQTDQTNIRAGANIYQIQGVLTSETVPAAAGVLVPETKLNLKQLPNKVYAASLDGWL